MPAVLVHGVPETPVVWDPLRSRLRRTDVVALQLPGFGVSAPEGFSATKEEYVDWLAGELEAIDEPVDLVGHDWGGGFALRIATTRPELLRSWVSDVAGILDPEYQWHDFAKIWQTPDAGEQFFADQMVQPIEARTGLYESLGIAPDAALEFVKASDEEMGRCILALYRSATEAALVEWYKDAAAAAARPGLVLAAEADPFTGGTDKALRMATALGAEARVLEGLGHWWMQEDPAQGAQVLEDFWATVD